MWPRGRPVGYELGANELKSELAYWSSTEELSSLLTSRSGPASTTETSWNSWGDRSHTNQQQMVLVLALVSDREGVRSAYSGFTVCLDALTRFWCKSQEAANFMDAHAYACHGESIQSSDRIWDKSPKQLVPAAMGQQLSQMSDPELSFLLLLCWWTSTMVLIGIRSSGS